MNAPESHVEHAASVEIFQKISDYITSRIIYLLQDLGHRAEERTIKSKVDECLITALKESPPDVVETIGTHFSLGIVVEHGSPERAVITEVIRRAMFLVGIERIHFDPTGKRRIEFRSKK